MSSKNQNYGKMQQFEQYDKSTTSSDGSCIDKIKDFYRQSPLRFYIICGGIAAVLLILIIVIAVVASKKDDDEELPVVVDEKNVDKRRVDVILSKFPAREKTSYEDWQKYLAKFADEYKLNNETKVWLAYKWISQNIYYKAGATSPEGAYKNGYTDCVGYANLFWGACIPLGFADEEILFIHGTARLVNSCTANATGANHWWNAIKLNGTWNLVDQERGNRDKGEDDYYFLIYPEALIRNHYPLNASEQFLNKTYTPQQYCDQVGTNQVYGRAKFYKIEPDLHTINTNKVNGTIKYYYRKNTTEIKVTFLNETRYIKKDYGNFTKNENYFQINYFFPSSGTYYVMISANPDPSQYNFTSLSTHTVIVS